MKIKKIVIGVIIFIIPTYTVFSQDRTKVALSWIVSGITTVERGIDFALRNTDTYEVYESKPLNGISKYSIIENLPKGKYEMLYLGSHGYARIDTAVQIFFGILDLNTSDGYYLGSFRGKMPRGRNTPQVTIKVCTNNSPKRLTKVLRRRDIIKKDKELIMCSSYKSDSLVYLTFESLLRKGSR